MRNSLTFLLHSREEEVNQVQNETFILGGLDVCVRRGCAEPLPSSALSSVECT